MFRVLGDVRHRGIEASLTGQPLPGLNLVAGIVWLDPRVTGAAVEDGRLGRRPLGRTDTVLDIRLDHRANNTARLSLDARLLYNGDRIARVDNMLVILERATFDAGGRYRFRIGQAPATLRVQLRNITNVFGWRVFSGGGFATNDPRRIVASVTADF